MHLKNVKAGYSRKVLVREMENCVVDPFDPEEQEDAHGTVMRNRQHQTAEAAAHQHAKGRPRSSGILAVVPFRVVFSHSHPFCEVLVIAEKAMTSTWQSCSWYGGALSPSMTAGLSNARRVSGLLCLSLWEPFPTFPVISLTRTPKR